MVRGPVYSSTPLVLLCELETTRDPTSMRLSICSEHVTNTMKANAMMDVASAAIRMKPIDLCIQIQAIVNIVPQTLYPVS